MFVRVGPGFEYNLNDTNNDIHICRVSRIAPPAYVNLTLYTFVQIAQGKQVVEDGGDLFVSGAVESAESTKEAVPKVEVSSLNEEEWVNLGDDSSTEASSLVEFSIDRMMGELEANSIRIDELAKSESKSESEVIGGKNDKTSKGNLKSEP